MKNNQKTVKTGIYYVRDLLQYNEVSAIIHNIRTKGGNSDGLRNAPGSTTAHRYRSDIRCDRKEYFMKRILSLFLSLALLLTLLTAFQVGALTAHAHDAEDAPEAEASAVSEQPGEEDASAEPAPVPEESGEANTEEDNRPYCLINEKKNTLLVCKPCVRICRNTS